MDNEPSDDGGDDRKIIVNGLFGVTNDENTNEMNTVSTDQSDEIQMEVDYNTKIYLDKCLNSENPNESEIPKSFAADSENQEQLRTPNTPVNSDLNDENQLKIATNTTIDNDNFEKFCKENVQRNSKLSEDEDCSTVNVNSNNFGSHVLCPNSTDPDKCEIPSSFALISENYEKSRKDNVGTVIEIENQTKCNQPSEFNAKSVVVLPKGSLPSTLSMISANYQDSSSDDSDSSTSSIDNVIDSDDESSVISALKEGPVKTRGELDISDLPPIEDLKITVEEEECQPVGCIKSIVNTLVIVEGFLNQPALDIDSVLFVDRGQRAIGRIFDVFGPVNKPYYAVRFNDSEHIKKFDIQIKEPVYCAPQTEYASFVLVSRLMEMKGSDASWRHNNEPPSECLDYSDDESEKIAKRKRLKRKKKCANSEENDSFKKEKSPNPSAQNVAKKNSKSTASTSNSSHRNLNRPQNTNIRPRHPNSCSPRPPNMYSPGPSNYGYGPRHFPTYAQHLSSMDYSHTYRQPYNPYYYDQMYPPRQGYPYQHPYRPPVYDYRSPRPPMNPDNPNQFNQQDYDYM